MKKPLLWLLIVVSTQACKIADLRTPSISRKMPDREEKALLLLENVISTNHLQKLAAAGTYSLEASDNWKGLLAVMNPLPKDNTAMELRFRPNSFDGQFQYSGRKKKIVHGVHSMQYYKIKKDSSIVLRRKKKVVFSLPAIQYFFELPLRLRNAPILKHAGTTTIEGRNYDLVFATWKQPEPHKENDQYLLYIDKEMGQLDFANYTVRGLYLPAPGSIYGSIRFSDRKMNEDGITYPGMLTIQFNQLKKEESFAHRISITQLTLNSFPLEGLYPLEGLEYLGDEKRGH
ncbi:MAG: hypothetical protein AAF717_05975 [Bacteroidota bacterium]